MKNRRIATSILASLVAGTAFLAAGCTDSDPTIEITADTIDRLGADGSVDIDISQPAVYVLDSDERPLDYGRIQLVMADAEPLPMTSFVASLTDDYGAEFAQAATRRLVLDTSGSSQSPLGDGVAERKTTSCSSDGKIRFVCWYDDWTGKLVQCDIYARTRTAN